MSRYGAGFISGLSGGNDQFTKFLLHCDGANGGTLFPDAAIGGAPRVWTNNGAVTTTFSPKFGTASFQSTGAGYLTIADHPDFTLGSNDFTLDFWIWAVSAGAGLQSKNLMGQVDSAASIASSSIALFTNAASRLQFTASVGGTAYTVTSTTQLNQSAWIAVECCREGGNLKLRINGVQEGGDVAISGAVNDSANNWSIGRAGERAGFVPTCFLDEIRLSVGIARHTANYTPETAAYF